MQFDVDPRSSKQAKSPHELFVINVLVFHLLAVVISLSINQPLLGLALPPLFTLGCILISLYQMQHYRRQNNWFVAAHWQLALRRYLILVIAYGVTLAVLGLAWLTTHGEQAASTADILFAALSRIAIMPTLVSLMVLALIEAGAMFQAMKGQLPDGFASKIQANER